MKASRCGNSVSCRSWAPFRGRAVRRPQAAGRKIMLHCPRGYMADWSRRAALTGTAPTHDGRQRRPLFADRRSQVAKSCHIAPGGYMVNWSQQAAQGSLYRGAGRQRRSERLKVGPHDSPERGVFYEPRVLIRYPAPVGATTWGARYALRVSRSAVVSLSLTPRSGI